MGEEDREESEEASMLRRRRAALLLCVQQLSLALIGLQTVAQSAALVANDQLNKTIPQPYHTSILTGHGGHPDRICAELGVRRHVFLRLVDLLKRYQYVDSRHIHIEEQLATFLYACVTGLSVCHIGEQFQRSSNTISRYIFPLPSFN
ncbi:hypothetical protein SERLADRAFT_392682 [Serpula lacrymans var. lacrymans S7.9]|uniref:DUF8040 domain-containing protein n=1 Tax=Serpula lacrymans var. lacrymans (strain S7.9) TaxID=578457 RepID=F8NZF2_SERL9|nr:uncharacterized protein SERLADRAFT_392682 [Serpula lacrymans var. lacrymans S7.9]EGO23972.1 hypothetical protein SERLADRAFT_392682 [Serpula lacrymans var. lacrymans S7.9]